MKLKSIALENIRSYVKQDINFPEGSVLLSGNIGSGKSTILLAMEFALFGLLKGTLSGAALLRNGTDRGTVRMEFSVGDDNITIFRSLKRTKTSVTQDAGWIEVNGSRKDATAVELKQKVLELLNYPLELLTKSKSMIFRYTVYTPQEEMKHILFCSQEERLDILRKVFGVEKYKRVSSNAQVVASKVREKSREIAGFISDLEKKKDENKEKEAGIKEHEKKLRALAAPLKSATNNTLKAKAALVSIEKKIADLNSLQKELETEKVGLEHTMKEKKRLGEEVARLEKEVTGLKKESSKVEDLVPEINKKKLGIAAAEKSLRDLVREIQTIKVNLDNSKGIIENISELSKCPTCLQEVPPEHKQNIKKKEDSKVTRLTKELESKVKKEMAKGQEIERLKEELDNLLEKEKENAVAKQKALLIKEKEARLDKRMREGKEVKLRIGTLNASIAALFDSIEKFGKLNDEYSKAKDSYEKASDGQKALEVEKAGLDATVTALRGELKRLEAEIMEKENARSSLTTLSDMNDWLSKGFLALMSAMEKSIMFRVHEGFSSLFERWFSLLVESDLIKVSLDEYFTPRIEQNGYDIEYSYLSGGEKTAVALAYRLALNQIINDLMTDINTRDLIILDEPTDGFSTEQLDRMRLLLEELKIGQLVIVSHEPKIESFVDDVIRFQKEEHVSRAVS